MEPTEEEEERVPCANTKAVSFKQRTTCQRHDMSCSKVNRAEQEKLFASKKCVGRIYDAEEITCNSFTKRASASV